jgi:hypothetical protein
MNRTTMRTGAARVIVLSYRMSVFGKREYDCRVNVAIGAHRVRRGDETASGPSAMLLAWMRRHLSTFAPRPPLCCPTVKG